MDGNNFISDIRAGIGWVFKTFEITGAEKLTVMSGPTGESIDITNADDIKYITDNINALKYSKGEKVNSDGWSYALQWFDENGNHIGQLTILGDGYTIIYDGYYYKGMSVDYEIDLLFLGSQSSNIDATEPVFETDNISHITLFCTPSHEDGVEAPNECMEEIANWPGSFTIDKKAGASYSALDATISITTGSVLGVNQIRQSLGKLIFWA